MPSAQALLIQSPRIPKAAANSLQQGWPHIPEGALVTSSLQATPLSQFGDKISELHLVPEAYAVTKHNGG